MKALEVSLEGVETPFNFGIGTMKLNHVGNTYTLIDGPVPTYDGDLTAWGFDPPTDKIVPLVLTVPGAGTETEVTLSSTSGNMQTKYIKYSAFDTPTELYLVLNGNTDNYTITVKKNDKAKAITLTLNNQAK